MKRWSKSMIRGMLVLVLSAVLLMAGGAKTYARNYALKKYNKNRWEMMKKDYLKKKTDRLIFVKYKSGSKCTVEMWKKIPIYAEAGETAGSGTDGATAASAGQQTQATEQQLQSEAAGSEGQGTSGDTGTQAATSAAEAESPTAGTESPAAGTDAAAETGAQIEPTAEAAAETAPVVTGYTWKKILSTSGYVGRNGINKVRQGDRKTPVGKFHMTMAFGIRKNPGTAGISYTKLNKYHYWSGEKATYNTFVDVRKLGRKSVAGEHLISYKTFYNYAMAFDFNKKGVYKKGSAIFLHCTKPGRKYTAGCIAVPEKKMKKIVKNTTKQTMIFIYKK